jgi:hypothetical protein
MDGADNDDDCRGAYLLWSRPSTDAGTVQADGRYVADSRVIARLCKALQHQMENEEAVFRSSSLHSPLLVCFQSDATSYLTMWRRMLGSKSGQGLQRQSHDLCEFLIQRLFFATPRGCRVHESLCIIHPHGLCNMVKLPVYMCVRCPIN